MAARSPSSVLLPQGKFRYRFYKAQGIAKERIEELEGGDLASRTCLKSVWNGREVPM